MLSHKDRQQGKAKTKKGYVNLLVENGFVTKPSQNSLCKIIG